jgi:hypothetical protein
MNPDYERQLEFEIDRELKALPELAAPPTLIARVMRVLEERAPLPWYYRSWATWPIGLQAGTLFFLVALFVGLCFGAGMLPHTPEYAAASHKASGLLAIVTMIWNTVSVILGALVLAVKRLGTGFIAGFLVSMALGYAMCLGLGTLYVRIGFARHARI